MTKQGFMKMIADFHQQGMSDEMILSAFYAMYAEGRLPYEALLLFANELGYEPSPKFLSMSEEERKRAGFVKKGD